MSVEMNDSSDGNAFHRKDDPLNQRISRLIENHVFSGSVGREMMEKSYELQLEYYKDCLAKLNDSSFIHDRNQRVLKDLAGATNSRIVEGEEWLNDFPKSSPALALLNHFSIYKLTGIAQAELGLHESEIDDIPPPPIHFSSVYPIAERLKDDLYDAHLELPGVLGQIQKKGGFIGVPVNLTHQFNLILQRTEDFVKKYPNSLIVSFPEGGTSGRTNNGGPFDMLDFHRGTFVIASKLSLPILPIAQYFDPNSGFEIGVFKPIKLGQNLNNDEFAHAAQDSRTEMQAWLDNKKRIQAVKS